MTMLLSVRDVLRRRAEFAGTSVVGSTTPTPVTPGVAL